MRQHGFIPGKKVLLIYKNGSQEIAKIKHIEKGTLYFLDRDPVQLRKIEVC